MTLKLSTTRWRIFILKPRTQCITSRLTKVVISLFWSRMATLDKLQPKADIYSGSGSVHHLLGKEEEGGCLCVCVCICVSVAGAFFWFRNAFMCYTLCTAWVGHFLWRMSDAWYQHSHERVRLLICSSFSILLLLPHTLSWQTRFAWRVPNQGIDTHHLNVNYCEDGIIRVTTLLFSFFFSIIHYYITVECDPFLIIWNCCETLLLRLIMTLLPLRPVSLIHSLNFFGCLAWPIKRGVLHMVTHHQYPPATPTRLSEFSKERRM